MQDWDQILAETLERARQNGDFDHHPQKGKPLALPRQNAFADPNSELAHSLLKQGGYTLPWIEEGRDIDTALERARLEVAQAWHWKQVDEANGYAHHLTERRWHVAVQVFQSQVAVLNDRIAALNLRVPRAAFHRYNIDAAAELERVLRNK